MSSRTKRIVVLATLLASAVLLVLLMAFGDQFKKLVTRTEPAPQRPIKYWAHGDLDLHDDIPGKDFKKYFGHNRWRAAQEAVKAGSVKTELEYLVNDGEGDFFTSMYYDPALTAAVALYLDQLGITGDNPILKPESSLPVGERANEAHLRYLKNESDWDEALARIKAILLGKDVKYEIKQLSSYKSAMYMLPESLQGDKPAVVVKNTNNAGGHFIVFYVKLANGKTVEVRFRLECGYQPIDIPHWTPSDDDDPEPHTTTPAPKNRKDDPQENPSAHEYDFYSPDRKNNDPDTTETDEPVSPETYVAPTQPVTVVTPTPEAETDHGDGTTETHGGQEYVVETGDQNLPSLEDIADESNPNKPTAEPGLEELNSTEFTDFE